MDTQMFGYEAEQAYIEMLDECYPSVKLTGDAEYGVGGLLKSADPVAFRIGLDEYITHMVEEGQWTVEGYEEYEPEKEES